MICVKFFYILYFYIYMSESELQIDYLSEDPEIPGQKFALISIVGPHMPQKCDVWGLKIKGIEKDLERAKKMAENFQKIDNDYDIYIVEVGKFFPLDITSDKINDVVYQNKELNNLMKSYKENRLYAEDEWSKRKNEMLEKAKKQE